MMKLAVIADIHANYLALHAALEAAARAGAEAYLFLGDYVSDCPYPQRTMAQLYALRKRMPCYFVRGNREDYMLSHRRQPDDSWRDSSSTGSLLYTYENLTARDLDFFASMPVCMDIELPGAPVITACHGSPGKTKEWLMGARGEPLLDRYVREIRGELLLCGHTHRTAVLCRGGKTVIFCPSVGMPQDRESDARMLLLTLKDGEWLPELLSLCFDLERLVADFEESGLSARAMIWSASVIKSLRERRDCALQCVTLAWRLAERDGFNGGSVLPELYWRRAAEQLGII